MNAWKIDGLLDTHVVVDHVGDDAEHGIDDRWSTRTPHREPQAAILAQYDGGRHRGKWTLLRCDRVSLALDQAVHVWCARLRCEVVHLVIQQHSGSSGDSSR